MRVTRGQSHLVVVAVTVAKRVLLSFVIIVVDLVLTFEFKFIDTTFKRSFN